MNPNKNVAVSWFLVLKNVEQSASSGVTVRQGYERGETHLKTMGIIPVSAFFSKYLIVLISMLMFIVTLMIFFSDIMSTTYW